MPSGSPWTASPAGSTRRSTYPRPPRRWCGSSAASAAAPDPRRRPYDDVGVSDPVLDVDEAVFDVVEQIPPGRVSTYGGIGRLVGIGPRRVARALSSGG